MQAYLIVFLVDSIHPTWPHMPPRWCLWAV